MKKKITCQSDPVPMILQLIELLYCVANSTWKPWSFTINFILSLLNMFLHTYSSPKKIHKRGRTRKSYLYTLFHNSCPIHAFSPWLSTNIYPLFFYFLHVILCPHEHLLIYIHILLAKFHIWEQVFFSFWNCVT